MCGFLITNDRHAELDLWSAADNIAYRGPDATAEIYRLGSYNMIFHRLAIIDPGARSNQPIQLKRYSNYTLMCNGEIYNYKSLMAELDYTPETGSDCEIIIPMIEVYGVKRTCEMLDGVFAFIVHDAGKNVFYAGRDAFGVRPAFIANNGDKFGIASEAKALINLFDNIKVFPPGACWSSLNPRRFDRWYHYEWEEDQAMTLEQASEGTRHHLMNAVQKRMMSDRPLGSLLSGGLDSSLIAALVQSYSDAPIETFSIGMPGSPDLDYADIVAKYIGSTHARVELSANDFLGAIEDTIWRTESYDTTTIRASVGNWLVSKYISENSNIKVVFNGDGSDEVTMGYAYNALAPNDIAFSNENKRLLREIHLFDVLRSDRSVSSCGLEPRTPFLDKAFVDFYMSIPTKLKRFGGKHPEKFVLRNAFKGTGLIPDSALWRSKCAFSDGVSSSHNSWHTLVKRFVDARLDPELFKNASTKWRHCTPQLKESIYYRHVWELQFGESNESLIPHFWLPRWTNIIDPSARELKHYKE